MGSKQTYIKTISLSHSLQLYGCQLIDGVSLLVCLADSLYYPYQIFARWHLSMEAYGSTCNHQLMPAYALILVSTIFILISCPLLHILVTLNWRVIELSFLLVNYPLVQGGESHLWATPQAAIIKCSDTCCIPISFASGQGRHFVFRAFPRYI